MKDFILHYIEEKQDFYGELEEREIERFIHFTALNNKEDIENEVIKLLPESNYPYVVYTLGQKVMDDYEGANKDYKFN